MHQLEKIHCDNFRSCRDCEFPLADYTPMVGYNNGGKSNILEGIRWLLEGFSLGEHQFYDPGASVTVEGLISGIDDELLNQLAENHRQKIEPFCENGELRLRRTQEAPSRYKSAVDLEVWHPEEEENDGWKINPTGIDSAISALFPEPIEIGAMEDATEDVGKHKSTTTVGKLIGEVTDTIQEEYGQSIRATLTEVQELLGADGEERAPELTEFDEAANEIVEDFFPGVRIALHIPRPEIDSMFKSGTIKVFEETGGESREISALGHGAQRSIQMALVRYLADVGDDQAPESGRTLLLVDEPELYLHPQAAYRVQAALKSLSEGDYQVVFATHSPYMVTKEDVADTLIVRKTDERGTHALPTLRATVDERIEGAASQANTLFELGNASEVLFSDSVVLVEGKTERRLLPSLAEVFTGTSFRETKTAMVGMGSAYSIWKAMTVLDGVGIPVRAVVDLDYAFRAGVQAGLIEEDAEELAGCRDVLRDLAEDHGIALADDGFPMNSSELNAEEAFSVLAQDERAEGFIQSLHERLRQDNIWLWRKGALENHLGIGGKGEEEWGEFIDEVYEKRDDPPVSDPDSVSSCLAWLLEPEEV